MTGASSSSGKNSGGNREPGLRPRRLSDEPAGTAEPGRAALSQRASALAGSAWAAIRPTRNRATGYIAVGAVGALVGTSAIVGMGASGSVPNLADIGAWLGSSEKGSAAHANGLTGDVDGKVNLPTGNNPVSISQDGKTVLVLDKKTGKVIRIDPAQLTAEQSTEYSSSDLQLVAGGSFAYLVNPVKGSVQRIDPLTTAPVGAAKNLGVAPLGKAIVDPKGTLWVPEPTKGAVVPFAHGRKAAAVHVAKANHNLEMTLANGAAVVTDTNDALTTMLTTQGVGQRVKLPSYIDDASPETVLVPESTDGDVLPVLASGSGKMTLLNVKTAELTNAALGSGKDNRYGSPQVLGSKVYVPDESHGRLKVYDTIEAAVQPPVNVTKGSGELEVFVRNGLLWVNDQDNAAAAVINSDGKVNHIGKYQTHVPSAKKPKKNDPPAQDNVSNAPAPQPAPDPGRNQGNEDSGNGGDQGSDPTPGPKKPKPQQPCDVDPAKCGIVPPAAPPGTPQVQSGPNGITINFAPSSGMKPTGYQLGGTPAGATVNPAQVSPDGPFTFQVGSLSCAQEYSFTIKALFDGGQTKESTPSVPIRPCTVPSAPQGLRVTVPQGGHGATVAWQAPSNASGKIGYTVSWAGQSRTTTGTSFTITGLQNGTTYPITVTSSNEAGGGAPASVTANLTPPARTMNIVDNRADGQPVKMRSGPSTSSATVGGGIPAGWNGAVTVHCKTTGSMATYPGGTAKTNYWSKITYNGTTGYISDLWLEARNNPAVWTCT